MRFSDDWKRNVGNADDEFTVEVHHGGFFVGYESNKAYLNEQVNWFDHCEVDTWSVICLEDFAFKLNYPRKPDLKFHWLLLG